MKSRFAVWVMVGTLAVLGSWGLPTTAMADDAAPAIEGVPLTDAELDARLAEIMADTDLQTAQWGYYGTYSYYGPAYGYYYGYSYPYTSYYSYYPYHYPYAYTSYYRPYSYASFYGPAYGVYYYSAPVYVGYRYRGCYYW